MFFTDGLYELVLWCRLPSWFFILKFHVLVVELFLVMLLPFCFSLFYFCNVTAAFFLVMFLYWRSLCGDPKHKTKTYRYEQSNTIFILTFFKWNINNKDISCNLFQKKKAHLLTWAVLNRSGSVVMFRCISTVATRRCVPIGYCVSRRDVRGQSTCFWFVIM